MKHTRKYNNIMNHPHVSILIDNRNNNASDFKDAVAPIVTGKITCMVPGKYQNLYLIRFPHLKDFTEDPECITLTLKMDKFIYMQRFQEMLDLEIP